MTDLRYENDAQKEAITTTEGPVLIIAGPGTGKTHTLVKRTIYLITEKKVDPGSVFIATFTDKAAKELITRITDEVEKPGVRKALAERGVKLNLDDMYIGTFHSICLKILKKYSEYTDLPRNFRALDLFGQNYLVYTNIGRFIGKDRKKPKIRNIDSFINMTAFVDGKQRGKSEWAIATEICENVSRISEELISADALMASGDPAAAAAGKMLQTYEELLRENNCIDFSGMQTKVYSLLTSNRDILEELRSKISYIMVDEYQDTNYVQEQLALLIAGNKKNICVVGDDDQGLYRFRGATIRNILEFPRRFQNCREIHLNINYRSDPQIIDFYNKWMDPARNSGITFSWRDETNNYRFDKTIVPCEDRVKQRRKMRSPAVIKLSDTDASDWYDKTAAFILALKESGKITDYNQIAFLFSSTAGAKAKALANKLEEKGINVYNPRANMFFDRDEIRFALACIAYMFPLYSREENETETSYIRSMPEYYNDIIDHLNAVRRAQPEYKEFWKWLDNRRKLHAEMIFTDDPDESGRRKGKRGITLSSMLYKISTLYPPFRKPLGIDLKKAGAVDTRPVRNLSILTGIIAGFEDVGAGKKGIRRIRRLTRSNIKDSVERLFGQYIKYQRMSHVDEDSSEQAPSGCVSFLTFHQAKGLEFPIVFVDSLFSQPQNQSRGVMPRLEELGFARLPFEPPENIKYYDHWRVYYTAFSRAKDLLVLTCLECPKMNNGYECPRPLFKPMYDPLPEYGDRSFSINDFNFASVKNPELKETFSFTSHISVYDACALQAELYRELGFRHVRAGAMLFGTLVHETIEDIHRAAIAKNYDLINDDNIEMWFEANYTILSQKENQSLGEEQKKAALKQVKRYAALHRDDWDNIVSTEEDVTIVQDKFIVEGKIDLIRADGDSVEIVDFKTYAKPKGKALDENLKKCRDQLSVYSYLVEERTHRKVSSMSIYYTSEEKDPKVTFEYKDKDVKKTMKSFSDTANAIISRDYSVTAIDHAGGSINNKVCSNCDFRDYCKATDPRCKKKK